MSEQVWKIIEEQRNVATNSQYSDLNGLFTGLDSVGSMIRESRDGKIPLEYHTEAFTKPAYQFIGTGRSIVYLNYEELTQMYNHPGGLEEYSRQWLGMSLDHLRYLLLNHEILIKLADGGMYGNTGIRQQIEDFFDRDLLQEARPLYFHAVEDLISETARGRTFNQLCSEQFREMKTGVSESGNEYYERCKKVFSDENQQFAGVSFSFEKLMHNYIRLKILRSYFDATEDKEARDSIEASMDSMVNVTNKLSRSPKAKNRKLLAQSSYHNYLLWGTPIYYSLGGKHSLVGLEEYWKWAHPWAKRLIEGATLGHYDTIVNLKEWLFSTKPEGRSKLEDVMYKHKEAISQKNEDSVKTQESELRKHISEVEEFRKSHKCSDKNYYNELQIAFGGNFFPIEGYQSHHTDYGDRTSRNVTVLLSVFDFVGPIVTQILDPRGFGSSMLAVGALTLSYRLGKRYLPDRIDIGSIQRKWKRTRSPSYRDVTFRVLKLNLSGVESQTSVVTYE